VTNQQPGAAADPVFILCQARTGSTLLRLLLDCHPELTCPDETNLPALCNNMLPVWSLVTGNPAPVPNMPFDISRLPREVTEGLRKSMDLIMSTHLERSGKLRWCDKSLGSAQFAALLLELYPKARFLCLHRLPMDVIASAHEACPYGLSGYGYEPYIAASPGNSVLAVARCWLDMTAEIMSAEEEFGEHCLRVRYEDLVTDPETVMDGVFKFLGVPPVPGIAAECFSSEPERLGTADYKVWHTNRVSSDSVGRGWNIPPGLISEPVLDGVNELAGRLGYMRVDPESWGIGPVPRDLWSAGSSPAVPRGTAGDSREVNVTAALLCETARNTLGRLDGAAAPRWLAVAGETVAMIVVPDPHEQGGCMQVTVNVTARRAEAVEPAESATLAPPQGPGAYALAGPAAAWRGVLAGELNLGAAMRLNQIRVCGHAEDWRTGQLVIAMVSDLLGLTSWNRGPGERARATPAIVA
jgi:hypothetical protein